jgi:hypothetical protein
MAFEQGVPADQAAAIPARKPGGILIFVPLLIALLGVATIVLGQLPGMQAATAPSGYGIDELVTGAIAASPVEDPIIKLDR